MKDAVCASGICKGFNTIFRGKKEVLKDINLLIDGEEIFGILGPNGSGKTTLLSIFSTLIYPDSGELTILGIDARRNTHEVRKLINISTGKPNFPWSLTVKENLRHSGMLYGLHGRELDRAVDWSMESFELYQYQDTRFENLSTGVKQRLSLAKAMLNGPKLLFLDEPTTGLDPQMAQRTRALVKRIHRDMGVSVVMTTHYMPEAEELCGMIAFLKEGRIIAQDTPARLKRNLKIGERMRIRYSGNIDCDALRSIPGLISAEISKGRADLVVDKNEATFSRVMRTFQSAEILELELEEPDLEDVFIELAG
ncbi:MULTISPECIES: ABC transporter ATP-binding protein [Methanothrix]|uniref:ABC transporter related protein n=1 Tax=Methanothrix thermoacetophila (strain DSM 6194 / JCM 14653 / NBRC 101360 / PT) TaxID=349307 RepID=A0B646_METTP|nr:ABC transporter ATP-binding protein [Methanothrix thermoacetophila]ABK14170.1 ABC transporter related protein [Methanothrix thermoacetophila PT]